MARVTPVIICALLAGVASESLLANPIRKVVGMLQDMQKTVEAEGEKEKELFDKFMCYCNNGAGSLDASIQAASSQVEALTGKIETDTAQRSQSQQDIGQHKTDGAAAQTTIKESTAMREKEASEFAASSGEMKANIAAMTGALDALKKGLSASLLQTSVGQTLKSLLEHSPAVPDAERSTLLSFLETGEGGSDQIVGVVAQMKETMEADLKETTASEQEAKASFESLVASKTKEVAAAQKAVEEKTVRVGELAVSVAQGKADLEDTQGSLEEDKKFKANLAASCATKSEEWDKRSKLRAEEVQAISETVEMLNGDDALELFKKTLPSASAFLQLSTSTRAQQRRAASLLRKVMIMDPAHSMNLRTMLLMLKSHNAGFETVVKMIDNMVATNAKEQKDDDEKRDFCNAEILKTQDHEHALKGSISDLSADLEEKEDAVATLASEIKALQQGIADLDKSVVEATEQRKDEHAEFLSTSAANQAALELIKMATNRMNKFYQPSLYKAPPTTTVADSPYGFVQIALHRADPGAPPATFEGDYKKSEGSTNIISMMNQMSKDVEMDIQEGKHDEESAQKDYERAMNDAATKRSDDSKLMVEKNGAKADEQTNAQAVRSERATKRDQLNIAQDKLYDLHVDCNHVLTNYDESKANRAKEDDMLNQAKSVLAGASFN
jgi:hypothetical protein